MTDFQPGDTYSYRSVTGGHLVTWTRDARGRWHADDDRGVTATDDDVRANASAPGLGVVRADPQLVHASVDTPPPAPEPPPPAAVPDVVPAPETVPDAPVPPVSHVPDAIPRTTRTRRPFDHDAARARAGSEGIGY